MRMKTLPYALLFLVLIVGGCTTSGGPSLSDSITVKDETGRPAVGVSVLFEEEVMTGLPYYFTATELKERTSNENGQAKIDLGKHLWTDGCYHFLLRKDGFQQKEVIVKKAKYSGEIIAVLEPLRAR